MSEHPNIVFVFADQMRVQAMGHAGNSQVRTPNMDGLASEGASLTHAVSCCPVCTPYRACLLTGRYPLSTGMVLNDVRLPTTEVTIAHALRDAGYDTAYVGKWHLDGPARGGFTPPGPRRQGFDFWAVGNCTHKYFHSVYYRDEDTPFFWDGYDAEAQTTLAVDYIRERGTRQFCLFLSWGPPHNPYRDAPEDCLAMYDAAGIRPRPNCPDPAPEDLAGYYAHVTALDRQLGRIMAALAECGLADNTILVFTSDHGDMLGSQGVHRKQWPWDESTLVPFLVRCPGVIPAGTRPRVLLNVVDVMPTLMAMAGVPVPDTVEGTDLSEALAGRAPGPESALIVSVCPFAENQGPEWRGVRTERHTYVRTRQGPWLLYDNEADPCQRTNLVENAGHPRLRGRLDDMLAEWLTRTDDEFLPREAYWKRFGFDVDATGAVPYSAAT